MLVTVMMYTFGDHRLRNALSTGNHIGLPRVLIHIAPHFQWPSVLQGRRWFTNSAITDYVRGRSPLHRSATTDYIEIAALSTGDYIGLPLVLIHIAPHFQWPFVLQGWRWYTTLAITDYVRTEIAASSFGDNRLHTHRDRRFIDWRSSPAYQNTHRSFLIACTSKRYMGWVQYFCSINHPLVKHKQITLIPNTPDDYSPYSFQTRFCLLEKCARWKLSKWF